MGKQGSNTQPAHTTPDHFPHRTGKSHVVLEEAVTEQRIPGRRRPATAIPKKHTLRLGNDASNIFLHHQGAGQGGRSSGGLAGCRRVGFLHVSTVRPGFPLDDAVARRHLPGRKGAEAESQAGGGRGGGGAGGGGGGGSRGRKGSTKVISGSKFVKSTIVASTVAGFCSHAYTITASSSGSSSGVSFFHLSTRVSASSFPVPSSSTPSSCSSFTAPTTISRNGRQKRL